MEKTVILNVRGPVAEVRINRPRALNALNAEVLRDLATTLDALENQPDARAVIVTGEGEKAFVAGADIKEMEHLSEADARALARRGQALFRRLADLPIPVIAAVNGFALGGGLELALACDIILASERAKWGLPEVTLGLIPGYGGTQRLAHVAGPAVARRVALSGDVFDARQGYEWGLFARVLAPEHLARAAEDLAATLATRAPRAVALAKRAITDGANLSFAEGLALEADLFGRAFATEDHREGIAAFIEKRPPVFRGR